MILAFAIVLMVVVVFLLGAACGYLAGTATDRDRP